MSITSWIKITGVLMLVGLSPLSPLVGVALAETSPVQAWVKTWNAPEGGEDIGYLVAVDSQEAVYVAGSAYRPFSGSDYDVVLLQYDASGNLVWERRFGGAGVEQVSDLIIPAPGEVAITGYFSDQDGAGILTLKYDRAGSLLWERRFPAPNQLLDRPPQMAADPDGNILVSGTAQENYLVLKYGPDGTLAWSRTHDGPMAGFDSASDVAAGPDGSVYVTGAADGQTTFSTVKYTAEGVFQWEQLEPGDINSVFEGTMVEVGPDGDPVVAGSPESPCGVYQFKIWKCSAASGSVLWSDKLPSQPCFTFDFSDLTMDRDGNAIATCSGSESDFLTHLVTMKYAPDGTRMWVREFDGPGSGEDLATAVTTDRYGSVFVAGFTNFGAQNRDYEAVKYTADGTLAWSVTWGSDTGTNDTPQDVAVDPAGGVIVTGNSWNPAQNENIVTVRFQQETAADVVGPDAGASLRALVVQPNPARGGTAIQYILRAPGDVRIQAFTADGRLARNLAEGSLPAGTHEVRLREGAAGLPAGAYIIRMEAGGAVETAKLNLLP